MAGSSRGGDSATATGPECSSVSDIMESGTIILSVRGTRPKDGEGSDAQTRRRIGHAARLLIVNESRVGPQTIEQPRIVSRNHSQLTGQTRQLHPVAWATQSSIEPPTTCQTGQTRQLHPVAWASHPSGQVEEVLGTVKGSRGVPGQPASTRPLARSTRTIPTIPATIAIVSRREPILVAPIPGVSSLFADSSLDCAVSVNVP